MTPQERTLFKTMNDQQQAVFLLGKGVTARIDISCSSSNPGFYAYADEIMIAQAGIHKTEENAVKEGVYWLQQRLSTP